MFAFGQVTEPEPVLNGGEPMETDAAAQKEAVQQNGDHDQVSSNQNLQRLFYFVCFRGFLNHVTTTSDRDDCDADADGRAIQRRPIGIEQRRKHERRRVRSPSHDSKTARRGNEGERRRFQRCALAANCTASIACLAFRPCNVWTPVCRLKVPGSFRYCAGVRAKNQHLLRRKSTSISRACDMPYNLPETWSLCNVFHAGLSHQASYEKCEELATLQYI